MASKRPLGLSNRRASPSPAPTSCQWCTVANDHKTVADPSGSGTLSAVPSTHVDTGIAGEGAGQPQHHRRRVDASHPGTTTRGFPHRAAGAGSDVDDPVAGRDIGQPASQSRVGPSHP